ncbi:MAG: cupin domain-containing protein [Sphingobacteriia bacterium]|nr:cupin domain-containing protein [Sphingobacteriia bacterium]
MLLITRSLAIFTILLTLSNCAANNYQNNKIVKNEKMQMIGLYNDNNNQSYFKDIDINVTPIGIKAMTSGNYPINHLNLMEFDAGFETSYHNSINQQYIMVLEGVAEITASNGEKRIIKAGDILFAADNAGKGHRTKTLTRVRIAVANVK